MHTVTNPLQACNDIYFKPGGVFTAVGEKNNWSWLAFFIVLLMALVPQYLYVHFVDITWYQDLLIAAEGDLSPAEIDARRGFMTQSSFMAQHVIGTAIGFIIINAILAVYLHLCTRNDDSHVFGFTDWYGFTWWASMPIVLSSLVSVMILLLSDNHQVAPSVLAPLSLAYLFGVEVTSKWYGLLTAINLVSIWTIYLTTVGVARWTSFSTQKSLIIAAAPTVIITLIYLVVTIL
jgi:hypothetical protein